MADGSASARILVVDDEQGMRDMLSFELGGEGFEVVCAESGARAVEIAKSRKFDLVITDLKMPGMDGMVTLAALKTIDPSLEVIVATGYATVDTAIACMRQGAYDYIQKPFDLSELRLVIDRALEQRRLKGMVSLYQAGQVLISTLNLDELIQIGLELAEKVLDAAGVGLVLESHQAKRLDKFRLAGTSSPSDELLEKIARATLTEGVAVRCAAGGPRFSNACSYEGFRSCLALPLLAQEELRGVLVLLRDASRAPFSASDQQTGAVFATQLALALENARLVGELEDKVTELVDTRDKLVRAEKVALAGSLAGAVAHEVNNPLGYIRANLSALGEYLRDFGRAWEAAKLVAADLRAENDPELAGLADRLLQAGGIGQAVIDEQMRDLTPILEECREGVGRIAGLVSDFARLAKPPCPKTARPVELAGLIKKSIDHTGGDGRRDVRVEAEQSIPARVAPEDLETALSSLIGFFRMAGKNGSADAQQPIRVRIAESRGRPLVELCDPQLFLSEQERVDVFDPRIEKGRGSGSTMRLNIGLAIAHRLLQANGAELTVQSSRDRGTTFGILLNRTE